METDVRTPSFVVTQVTCLTSAFTGCPIGFAASSPRRRDDAWRIVARYRSGTVAGFHGLSCFRDEGQKRWLLPKFKELNLTLDAKEIESMYKSKYPHTLMRLVGTMATVIFATGATFEMEGSGENNVPIVVQIRIFVIVLRTTIGQYLPDFREDGVGAIEFAGNSGHHLKTRATQASRFETISRQTTENMIWDNDLMTPARPLIEVSLGHTAAVVPAAEGTPLISAQAFGLAEDRRRLVVRFLRFHAAFMP